MKTVLFPYTDDMEVILAHDGFRDLQIIGADSFPENRVRIPESRRIDLSDSVDAEKVVILTATLPEGEEEIRRISGIMRERGIPVLRRITDETDRLNYEPLKKELPVDEYSGMVDKRYPIPVPVVMIVSAGCSCGKFETHLTVSEEFEKAGYKVTDLCSNPLGALFGMYTVPPFLDSGTIGYGEKIRTLNKYVWCVYQKEKPDVIVLSVPGGVFFRTDDPKEPYGEYLAIFSQAVEADAVILNIYDDMQIDTQEDMEDLAVNLQYRFGFSVYSIMRQRVIARRNEETGVYEYYHLPLAGRKEEDLVINGKDELKETVAVLIQEMQEGTSEV